MSIKFTPILREILRKKLVGMRAIICVLNCPLKQKQIIDVSNKVTIIVEEEVQKNECAYRKGKQEYLVCKPGSQAVCHCVSQIKGHCE